MKIRVKCSRRRVAGRARAIAALAACLILGGCCMKMVKDITLHMMNNAPKIVVAIGKAASSQYIGAVKDLFQVCSGINTRCPPKAIPPEVLSKLPIEVDFNLLHEYLDAAGDVKVSTIPPVDPGQIQSEADARDLYGVAEDDNYKFVLVSHHDLFIYVFQLDATGKVDWQYPRATQSTLGTETINPWPDAEGVNPTPAEKIIRLPESDDYWWGLDTNGRDGVENIIIVASKYRQIELEEALSRAVQAAQTERAANPQAFSETVVQLPLLVPPDRNGLTNEAGEARGETRTVQTESGPVAYTPQTFKGDADTVVMVRSFYHLMPRSSGAGN